jgi:cytoskeletal protein CcmA (bactofilin family)
VAIFGKKDRDPAAEGALPPPDFRDEPSRGEVLGGARREVAATTFGPTLKVKGEVSGDEDVTIEGRLEGLLNLSRSLTVGKTGVVEADVRAQTVVIHGRVTGNVIAEHKVEIYPSGRLEGNIKSPKISIHEGAHFKGNVDMSAGASGATLAAAPVPAEAGGTPRRAAYERKL